MYHYCCRIVLLLLFILPQAWAADTPVPVYLTWQHSPCTTITIQWITPTHEKSCLIEYHAQDKEQWTKAQGMQQFMPEGMRALLHRTELTQLSPGTDYYFRIPPSEIIYKFKTLPNVLNEPVSFAVGGDFYHDDLSNVIETNRQAAKLSPSFVIVGGDIAYSTPRFKWLPESGARWIEFLLTWTQTMVTPEGRMIPILPAIGNHDCKGSFNRTPDCALYFYTLFSFPGNRGHDVTDFGDYMSIISLDSGITHPIEGEQTHWLSHVLDERTQVPNKFAVYHVPAYPSVRDFNLKESVQIRKHWIPLFEKFGLTAAFENHEHAYKRSQLILENQVNPKGVLYIGDGGWGMKKPRVPYTPSQAWYIAKSASARHFIFVTLEPNKRSYQAYDSAGRLLDEFTH